MRPLLKKKISLCIFNIGQVAWNNLTTCKILRVSSFYRAGRLEQLDHSRNPFRVLFFLSGRSPGTIRPLAKPFSRFILHRGMSPGTIRPLVKSFSRFFLLSGRSPRTIRPLAKPFSRFILPIGQVVWNN
jgi:hypothetical protein